MMSNRYTITKNVLKEYDDYIIQQRTIGTNLSIISIKERIELKIIKIQKDPKKIISNKLKFMEFVYLSEGEYGNLITGYGLTMVKDVINRLNNYIGSKGDKYKSHYHTILTRFQKSGINRIDTQKDITPQPTIPAEKEFIPLTEEQKQEIKDKYLLLKQKLGK